MKQIAELEKQKLAIDAKIQALKDNDVYVYIVKGKTGEGADAHTWNAEAHMNWCEADLRKDALNHGLSVNSALMPVMKDLSINHCRAVEQNMNQFDKKCRVANTGAKYQVEGVRLCT